MFLDPEESNASPLVISPIDVSAMVGVKLAVDCEGDLLDSSGNGFNLLATIAPEYLEIDGKLGLWSRASQSIVMVSGIGDYADLKLYGAATFHALIFVADQILGSTAIVLNFSGTGETEAANTLYSLEQQTTGQLSYFHEHGAGVDDRVTLEWFPPVGRWGLLTVTRRPGAVSGVDCVAYLNGAQIDAWSEADAPTGGTAAQIKSSGFAGLLGGFVITNAEQSAADVLAVAEQVGVA
ncbi:MAG: hypothetical protein A2V88_00855 [Elusimicrobia bacterium RBG_16_66_12]|nr:MAG: hypothetical protein A2V88_00855 [Elusimicrobia bacterium RBG_16_66_12]